MRERRCQYISISPNLMLTLLAGWRRHDFVRLPVLAGLPDDAEVQSVTWDWQANVFQVLLYHPSWPAVPDGDYAPRYGEPAGVHFQTLEFRKPEGADDPLIVERPAEQGKG